MKQDTKVQGYKNLSILIFYLAKNQPSLLMGKITCDERYVLASRVD
jgi:hypothetical protein